MSLRVSEYLIGRYLIACVSVVGLAVDADASADVSADISSPRVKWSFQSEGPIRGSAVIAGDSIYFGSADGNVYALAKATGELRWKVATGGAIAGAPAIADSTVIVSGRNAMVHALDASRGTVRWTFEMQRVEPASIEWTYFTAAPVIDGDQVLVPSLDGRLYALDLASGTQRWHVATGDSLYASPLVADGTVYQPSGDDHLYALSRTDGKVLWRFATEGVNHDLSRGFTRSDIFTQPKLQDGLLVIGSRDANVYAIDIKQHSQRWKFAYDSTWAMSTNVHDDTVFVGWSTNNKINALDLLTGAQKWEFDAGAHTYTRALPVRDSVYFGSGNGLVHKLAAADGKLQWKYSVGSAIYSSLIHDGGVLYFGADDGRMIALTQSEGAPRKAVYQPAQIPDGIRGFLVDAAITPFLVEQGYTLLDSPQALTQWIGAQTSQPAPSVIVFAFAQIPRSAMGADPSSGPLRKYLESGGKVMWLWGVPNKYEFDEHGKFVANDPSVAAQLLDVEFLAFEDSGNYFNKPTQTGRNWGMPAWLTTTFASLKNADGVTALAHDEFGRVGPFLKSFHPRVGSGWVSFGPTGFGTPITQRELHTLERIASYAMQ
jgi:outer membrane protein assembly factor BamB